MAIAKSILDYYQIGDIFPKEQSDIRGLAYIVVYKNTHKLFLWTIHLEDGKPLFYDEAIFGNRIVINKQIPWRNKLDEKERLRILKCLKKEIRAKQCELTKMCPITKLPIESLTFGMMKRYVYKLKKFYQLYLNLCQGNVPIWKPDWNKIEEWPNLF